MNKSRVKLSEIKLLGFRAFITKAVQLGVQVYKYEEHVNLFRLTHKDKTVYSNNGFIPFNIQMGEFTINKEITKLILRENNIPTPNGFCIKTQKEALKLFNSNALSIPLIIKPLDGSQALGVTWNITTQSQLLQAIQYLKDKQKNHASLKSKSFLMEEMVFGDEYRILVLKNKVISCVRKLPATVIGDGTSSINQLVKAQNKKRLPDFPIKLDNIAKDKLKEYNYTINSIPKKSQKVILRNDMMISNGGRTIDCTQIINKKLQKQCVQATQLLGLEYAGIDLISKDITKNNDFTILEINTKPAHILNEKPIVEGNGVDVSLLLLQEIFPDINNNK